MKSLDECRDELSSIITELWNIEADVRDCGEGIGQDLCADCIDLIVNKYRGVMAKLNRVDVNRLADWVTGGQDA